MASSNAASVEEYLAELPEDRREVVVRVRELIRRHLPAGYHERIASGMINYEVPVERYPDTYNGQPLAYVALAAQRNHYALYMMGLYSDPAAAERFRDEYRASGSKLDMGKSCVRFRRLDDLPLDVVGRAIAAMPPDALIERYEASRSR